MQNEACPPFTPAVDFCAREQVGGVLFLLMQHWRPGSCGPQFEEPAQKQLTSGVSESEGLGWEQRGSASPAGLQESQVPV